MPAPRTKPGAALLPALLLVAACASNRPENAAPAAKPAAEATLEDLAPAPAPPMQPMQPEIDRLDETLAAYEQQLAHNESRLRAMGVRLAAAEPVQAEPAEQAPHDGRFAAPPPAKAAEAPTPREEKSEAKGKSRAKKTDAESPPRPRPAPQASAPASGRVATYKAEPRADEVADDTAPGRCAELCDLAHATCELEAKICALAQRHTDDPRYGEVCRRAGEDCHLASEACKQCSP